MELNDGGNRILKPSQHLFGIIGIVGPYVRNREHAQVQCLHQQMFNPSEQSATLQSLVIEQKMDEGY